MSAESVLTAESTIAEFVLPGMLEKSLTPQLEKT
jgi:hypothetical protein